MRSRSGETSAPDAAGSARTIRLFAVAAAVVAADQITKAWAVQALDDGPVDVFGSAVQFDLMRNTGSAFSLFTGFTPLLAVLAAVLAVIIVRMGHRESDPWLRMGLALVLGGALGNLGDRIFRAPGFLRGAVIDFVDVGAWPTFNVADAAITVGAALLVLRGWRGGRDEDSEGPGAGQAAPSPREGQDGHDGRGVAPSGGTAPDRGGEAPTGDA